MDPPRMDLGERVGVARERGCVGERERPPYIILRQSFPLITKIPFRSGFL
jgi:hypothetical protein